MSNEAPERDFTRQAVFYTAAATMTYIAAWNIGAAHHEAGRFVLDLALAAWFFTSATRGASK